MKIFNSIEELKPYYNDKTNTYEFVENGLRMDVEFNFELSVDSHITAGDINAWHINARDIKAGDINAWNIDARDINAWNIKAWHINARDINARDINAWNIDARDINAWNIKAGDINAWHINARDIKAGDINAWNIDAWNIKAGDINAWDILYYAVCFAYQNIICTSIKGRRENAKHFVLDGEITIKPKEQPKQKVTLELTEEQLAKVKEMLK